MDRVAFYRCDRCEGYDGACFEPGELKVKDGLLLCDDCFIEHYSFKEWEAATRFRPGNCQDLSVVITQFKQSLSCIVQILESSISRIDTMEKGMVNAKKMMVSR